MSLNRLFHCMTNCVSKPISRNQLLASNILLPIRNMSSTAYNVKHDEKRQKFLIELDEEHSAFIQYEGLSNNEVLLYHTEVPKEYGGKGLGKILAEKAFKHFEDNGQKMVITCTYLQKLDKQRKAN